MARVAIFVPLASVRERRRSDGTRSFAVLWRDPETGRQTSLTYDDERDARVAKELIEAAGGHAAEAARIAEAVRAPGPLVREVVPSTSTCSPASAPIRGRTTAASSRRTSLRCSGRTRWPR